MHLPDEEVTFARSKLRAHVMPQQPSPVHYMLELATLPRSYWGPCFQAWLREVEKSFDSCSMRMAFRLKSF